MGIFRRSEAPKTDTGELTPQDALAGIAMAAAYADGVLGAEEDESLVLSLTQLRSFKAIDERALRDSLQKVHALTRALGESGALVACAEALPAHMRPTAYLVAADILLADDDFTSEEQTFLKDLEGVLKVEPSVAAMVRDVLAIRHAV